MELFAAQVPAGDTRCLTDEEGLADTHAEVHTLAELDLRPGIINPAQAGVAGGKYPFWVVWTGNTAYVSSLRDREIDVLDLSSGTPKVTNRIAVNGNPNKMLTFTALNGRQILLAAVDNEDNVVAIDTGLGTVIDTIPVTAPPPPDQTVYSQFLKGANPNSLALSPDRRTLRVTNSGENVIAVIALNTYIAPSYVRGLIPTGWYPSAVALSTEGSTLFNAFTKNIPGPIRDGRDLRQNRPQLLKDYVAQQKSAKKRKARHTAKVEKPEAEDVD